MKWIPRCYKSIYTPQLCYAVGRLFAPQLSYKILKSKGAALILCVYSRLLLLPCTLIYICLLWCLTLESANVMALTRACLFNKIIFFYILVSTNEWQSEGRKTLTIDTVTEKNVALWRPTDRLTLTNIYLHMIYIYMYMLLIRINVSVWFIISFVNEIIR